MSVAEHAVTGLGGLDVLVGNAGFQHTYDQLEKFPPDQIERTFATNVFSTFWLVQQLATELEHGGSVIVTTSIQAYSPSSHLLDYAASLNNLTVNLPGELGPRGVQVNAVAPARSGHLIPSTMDLEKVESFGADTPLGRAGQPVEAPRSPKRPVG